MCCIKVRETSDCKNHKIIYIHNSYSQAGIYAIVPRVAMQHRGQNISYVSNREFRFQQTQTVLNDENKDTSLQVLIL